MEIKDIKAEYRMQEMHKMIQSRAESGLTVSELNIPSQFNSETGENEH